MAAAALVVGAAIGTSLALARRSPPANMRDQSLTHPNASWSAGARRAPDFRLVDQRGAPISLRSLRGRPVIVTFIDPLCRTLCPFETRVLNQAVTSLPPATRPAVVAVSVDPWGDSRQTFREDGERWQLVPQWRWAVGSYSRLAAVWRSYDIGVRVRRRVIAGITIHDISHTEASYVIDAAGYERALYVYPFRAADVALSVQQLARLHE